MRSHAVNILSLVGALVTGACGDTRPGAEEATAADTSGTSGSTGGDTSGTAPTTSEGPGEPPTTGDPFSDCDLHEYIKKWAGAGATDCGDLAADAPADEYVQLHDCVLAQIAADAPFVASGLNGVFAGRAEEEPKLSNWSFNGAGYVAVGCASITPVANCTPMSGEVCLQCDGPSNAIDNYCIAM